MLKSNKRWIIVLMLLCISLALGVPFINGIGCNANIIIKNKDLGVFYGRCEYGRLTFAVNHGITQEAYDANAIFGYWHGKYYIIVTQRNYPAEYNADRTTLIKRVLYYRNFYSGTLFGSKQDYYSISLSFEPSISEVTLRGRLGFIP